MSKLFYLTTTLPYVNAKPHIGFALEITAADVLARFHTQQGDLVIFNTGTDEHGQKIYQQALEAGQSPQAYCDAYAASFAELKSLLNLSYNHFIRTTDSHHEVAAQEFWRLCLANGDIYKKTYQTKYCVGCELEKTDSELQDGVCPLHPTKTIELRDEENYFFRFSKYAQPLLAHYQAHPDFVKPNYRLKEITSFVKQGLQDFSISRLKAKMPWGITVPNDPDHVMYVWFDALINYISTLGWPQSGSDFSSYWPGIQVAGKDNLRQQAAMWQAMLLSANLPVSKQILINGFIGVNGQKMSKSLGNVIAPQELVARYGGDATRYLLINLGPFGEDMDVSWERLDQEYTALLANGYGNLCSRLVRLAQKIELNYTTDSPPAWVAAIESSFAEASLTTAMAQIQDQVRSLDAYLSEQKPWTLTKELQIPILATALNQLYWLTKVLTPIMPTTTSHVLTALQNTQVGMSPQFPRLTPRIPS